jgi:hypothetical protein
LFATRPLGWAAKIEGKCGHQEQFAVADVAAIFDVAPTTVREWIDEGRLPAVDLNAGRRVDAHDPASPEMRPYWRIMRQSVIDLAKLIESGI